MTRIDKPWGHEDILERNSAFVVKRILLHEGRRTSLQVHRFKQEWVRVEDGVVDLWTGRDAENLEVRRLNAGGEYRVPPETVHRVEAVTECVYLEVCTPHDDDIVRLEDDYGR